MVKEFFANMVEDEGKKVYVRGHWIDFSKERINMLFNLKVQKDGLKFKKLLKEPNYQKIVDMLIAGKGKWKGRKKTLYKSISKGDLTEEAKVWFYFTSSALLPSKHLRVCSDPQARADPIGESEPKPRGRPFNSFYLHFISFSFSKVSRPKSLARLEGRIRTRAWFTPTFSIILSKHFLYVISI